MIGLDPELFSADGEDEWESEDEFESEFESLSPGAPSTALLMEHLGALAAETESEAEAEALLGALGALGAKGLGPVAKAIPTIVRGVADVGGQLWRNPTTRGMVRAIPRVVRRTTVDLARQYGDGRPVTANTAARTLARHTADALSTPERCRAALRRSQAMSKRWRTQQGRATPARQVPTAPR